MKASATGTAWNRCALIRLPKASPSTAAGMNATTRLTTKRCATGSLPRPVERAGEARAVFPHHREHGAGLDRDLEDLGLSRRVKPSSCAGDDEVAGARDRQEFGETFDDAEYQRP